MFLKLVLETRSYEVAYEKFLAIYNEMRGSEEGSEWPDGAEAVDATA